ncbi:MAG: ATP-binding protein [Candidatus Limnocylindrus sp.]
MSLQVRKTQPDRPKRILLYGVEGIGKTTWASQAPGALFLGAEEGYGMLEVDALPAPSGWRDVLATVRALGAEKHGYQTLVLDTVDWLEGLLFRSLCERAGVDSIEDVGGGYGKGYTQAVEAWRELLAMLADLTARTGMTIVCLAHCHIKTMKNPEGPDFDRYQMKMNEKSAAVLREWADVMLFATYEDTVALAKAVRDPGKQAHSRGKALDTGRRVMHTTRRAAFDAKNRHGLPPMLPMSWSALESHLPRSRGVSAEPWTDDAREVFAGVVADRFAELGVEAADPLAVLTAVAASRGMDLATCGHAKRMAVVDRLVKGSPAHEAVIAQAAAGGAP